MGKRTNTTRLAILVGVGIVVVAFGMKYYKTYQSTRPCMLKGLPAQKDHYFWLFDSSKRVMLDCKIPMGNPSIGKYWFLYTYAAQYRYVIFENHSYNSVPLRRVSDSTEAINPNGEYINPSEGGSYGWGGQLFASSKVCTDVCSELQITFNNGSQMARKSEADKIVFSGLMTNALLKNHEGEIQSLIRYDKPTRTTLVLYKPHGKLYFILINPFEGSEDFDMGLENLILE